MKYLGLRRRALEELGGYDESLEGGEDVDLSLRLARSHWLTHSSPAPGIRRRASGLLAQLKLAGREGFALPRVYRKHNPGRLEVYAGRVRLWQRSGLPGEIRVFIHPFLIMHLAALAWLLTGWLPSLALTGLALAVYVRPDVKSPGHAFSRYLLNVVFTLAHLGGGLRCGSLSLPPELAPAGHGLTLP